MTKKPANKQNSTLITILGDAMEEVSAEQRDIIISIHATHTGRDRNIQQIIAINLLRFSYIPYKKAWIRS